MQLWIALALFNSAFAGTATSGGGGAFVWRDAAGHVTQAELIDLWESENIDFQWADKIGTLTFSAERPFSASEYFQQSLERLAKYDKAFSEQVLKDYEYVNSHQHPLAPQIVLELPDDLKVDYRPRGSKAEGMLRFNGTTGLLDMDIEISRHITDPLQLAATFLHEAIYKTLRETISPHTNSILARHLNACLLSSNTTCLGTPPIQVPTDRWVFKCTGAVADYYVYPLSTTPPFEVAGYRVEFLRFGTSDFAYETFQEIHNYEFNRDGSSIARGESPDIHGPLDQFRYFPGKAAMELHVDWQGILTSASITEAKSAVAGGTDLLFNGADNSVCTKVH